MKQRKCSQDNLEQDAVSQAQTEPESVESAPPWEQIENGRYMPRRIRGSYRGRELG
jgi:hypothetical protein